MSIEQAKEVLKIEAEGILAVLDQVGPDFDKAVDLVLACPRSAPMAAGVIRSTVVTLPKLASLQYNTA